MFETLHIWLAISVTDLLTSVAPISKVQMLKQENEIRVLIYAYPHDNIKGRCYQVDIVKARTRAIRMYDVCDVIRTRT